MNTSIRSGFITDLVVPPDGTCNLSSAQLEEISIRTAVEILHDFPAFIHSNPLVQHVEPIVSGHPKFFDTTGYCTDFEVVEHGRQDVRGEWTHFAITDHLPIMGGAMGNKELVYATAMRKTTKGFEGLTNAGSGVRIHGRFEIEKSYEQPGIIHFIEHNETKCNVFLSVYIKATLASSHRNMHENFKKKWTEEMKRKLSQEEGRGRNSNSFARYDRNAAEKRLEQERSRSRLSQQASR